MGITARNFAALLILINLFSWHRLLLVLGDRSLSILSSFLGFLTLFLPGFSSGNWKQKKLSPPFSPSVWEFVCWCILETHCPGRFFFHNFRGARVAQWWERSPPTNVAPPGFKSRRRRHVWVEFVVGSLHCSERFFSGYSGFPLSSKTNTSKFQFDLERTDTFKRVHINS